MHFLRSVAWAVVLSLPGTMWAVEKAEQTGTVVTVERKINSRVLGYVVNSPIIREEPYYEIGLESEGFFFLGQYDPRTPEEELPDTWAVGKTLRMRVRGHRILLERAGRSEAELTLLKHKPLSPAGETKPKAR